MYKILLFALGLCQVALADQWFWWDITWVKAAPDGFSRPVIGINGHWPPPPVVANVGERLTFFVNNKLGNESTSIHFHGLRQFHANTMDGPTAVTQCPIPPGNFFTYSFVVDTPGTYWYHSHHMGQYPDGLRAPLIVKDPKGPHVGKYVKEYTLTFSDWYHKQMPEILKVFQSPANFPPQTPTPDSPIMNDGQPAKYDIEAGKTYLFRILNIGAFPSFFVNFQDHDMSIVGIDGVTTQPTPAKTLFVGVGQRYEVLITGKGNSTSNAAILGLFDTSEFEGPFSGNPAVLGELHYSDKLPAPPAYQGLPNSILPPINDATIKPYDNQPLLGPVNKQIVLNFNQTLINGIPRATINGNTYLPQKVPSLYTALTVPKQYKMDPRVYGVNSNSYAVNYGDVVEIVLNNLTPFGHPWHLHGHQFQVVARSPPNAGATYDPSKADPLPMKRDVAGVPPGAYVVFRFKADNPGVQLIHCHIEWHVEAGLTATILEATDHLDGLEIPWDHKAACIAQGIPFAGNAAGNLRDPLDLTGANTEVPAENNGAVVDSRSGGYGGYGGHHRVRRHMRGVGSLDGFEG